VAQDGWYYNMASIINASSSGAGGLISTGDSSGVLQLQSNASVAATVNAYGIGLGTGVPSSGIGITFPATQSASSDANTLDDYEEGTWTPNLIATSGSITAQTTTGTYVRVGKLVIVQISISSITVGASTALAINNLPFTVNSTGSGTNGEGLAREDKATGLLWFLGTAPATTTAYFYRYDNSSTVTSSLGWNGTLSYIST
jgi:hypothetical protein